MYHATTDGITYDLEIDPVNRQGRLNGQCFDLDLVAFSENRYHIILADRSFTVEIEKLDRETKTAQIRVNGVSRSVVVRDRYDDLLASMGLETGNARKMKEVKAPMPGMVIDVLVEEGTQVEKDTPLVILEAMKMENVIKAPVAGVIRKVLARKGVAVEKNSLLMEFA